MTADRQEQLRLLGRTYMDITGRQRQQQPPPYSGMVWQPYAMGGGEWVHPTVVRLSPDDIERIASAVVRMLRRPMPDPAPPPDDIAQAMP